MFSATVNTGMSWKCWCTMPMPAAIASAELVELHRLRREPDLAGVGLVQPEHDVHQRALAGAVLAEQAVHLALVQGEVDVLVGDDAGEALGDPPDLEDRTGAGPLPPHGAVLATCEPTLPDADGPAQSCAGPCSRASLALLRQSGDGVDAGRRCCRRRGRLAGLLHLDGTSSGTSASWNGA